MCGPLSRHQGMTNILDTDKTLLTCGGTETFLLFIQKVPLREFCSFELLDDPDVLASLEREFFTPIAEAAAAGGHALLLDAMVWRAHPDYVAALGYPAGDVERFNRRGVAAMRDFASRFRARNGLADSELPAIISGDIGPRGDGYRLASAALTIDEAADYHRPQLTALAEAGVDVVNALTMTSVAESAGIARVAAELGLPVIISPTVETDGTTPEGDALGVFIERVEEATGGAPQFYMVNCAHPSHLEPTLRAAADRGAAWLDRFRGLRANASRKSHAELDESETLDRGDPGELAGEIGRLYRDFDLRLVGGCCGTDAEHIAAIARAVS